MAIQGMCSMFEAVFMCFSPNLGVGTGGKAGGGGGPKGLVHNLLVEFFTLSTSKILAFDSWLFDIVTTQNDHPRYVKHVKGNFNVFFYLIWVFGAGGGGGGVPRDWYTNCLWNSSP